MLLLLVIVIVAVTVFTVERYIIFVSQRLVDLLCWIVGRRLYWGLLCSLFLSRKKSKSSRIYYCSILDGSAVLWEALRIRLIHLIYRGFTAGFDWLLVMLDPGLICWFTSLFTGPHVLHWRLPGLWSALCHCWRFTPVDALMSNFLGG